MDSDPNHTANATQEFVKAKWWKILQWPNQSPDPNLIEHAFHLLLSSSQGLAKHHKRANPAFGDVHGFQTWAVIACKGFSTMNILFMIILICPITLGPLK